MKGLAHHRIAAGRLRRALLVATAAAGLLGAGGCTLFGIANEAVRGPQKVPAVYTLPDHTTAVLVDTADTALDDPRLPRRVGTVALHHLRFHGAPDTAALVDAGQVARLEARLGDDWGHTPIDTIGRRLNARQVIYARLTSAGLNAHRGEQGSIPTLRLDVKVIDTRSGSRIWPPEGVAAPDGHAVVVQATIAQRRRRLAGQENPQQTLDQLADAAGLALAQVFYDWAPPPPGRELDR